MELTGYEHEIIKDFDYITKDDDYLRLKKLPRHGNTTTYDHSIRVAALASRIGSIMKADRECTIRAALLHDFCFVNYYEENDHPGWYIFYHPREAVKNAEKFQLSKEEKKAILSHMFPISSFPTSRSAWAITLADKVIAIYEKMYSLNSIKKKSVYLFRRVASFI